MQSKGHAALSPLPMLLSRFNTLNVGFNLQFSQNLADEFGMNSEIEKNQLWYNNVIEPKLKVLDELSLSALNLTDFEHNIFFKDFLADLEMLALDSYGTESKIDKIRAALDFLQDDNIRSQNINLKDIALIAYLDNSFDRILFFSRWRQYKHFKKAYAKVPDEVIFDATRVSVLLKNLVKDIQQRASELTTEAQAKAA